MYNTNGIKVKEKNSFWGFHHIFNIWKSISGVTTFSHLVALAVVLISKERCARISTGSVTGI